jgi:VanZ family protein
MIAKISRALAWAFAAAIVALSVVPPSLRPVTILPHGVEHFAAFVLCGFAFGAGYRMATLIEGAALVAFAGAIELVQLAVPGRHARVIDFVVDAIAICVGLLIGRAVSRVAADRRRKQV